METTRQNKIARLIQKELGDIFLLQTKAMPGVLVSVSIVRERVPVGTQRRNREKHQCEHEGYPL